MKPKSEIGIRYGRLVVESREGSTAGRMAKWRCVCDCGNKKVVVGSELRAGKTKSCGCLRKEPQRVDETGRRFGSYVVLRSLGADSHKHAIWLCRCDCGRAVRVVGINLRSGQCSRCKSCAGKTHGHSKRGLHTPEYRAWEGMIQRCTNTKNPMYRRYGGRGIAVCASWLESFANFLSDVGMRPSPELSIDRIDNDGNYEPGNCRWATRSQQQSNKGSRKQER